MSGRVSAGMIGAAILGGVIAYVALSRGLNGAGARNAAPAVALEEAYLILGLERGCGRHDVFAAYRNLMKRLHPDQGGPSYLAARVNEARDVLLKHIKI